jgi:hypothetical protein
MSSFPVGCNSVGVNPPEVEHTIENVGGGSEIYVNGTGPNPFELRTCTSTTGSVGITQGATTLDFRCDAANIGGFVEVYVDASDLPKKFRTFQSSDASVGIVQNVEDIDLTVPPSSGAEVFQVDSTATKSTTSTTYQTVTTLATDPLSQIKNGETWKINICILVCHPVNVFTVNTWIRWRIETAAGVFTTFDEWQINAPITIQQGEPSMPFHRTKKLTVAFDDPRMLVEVKMSAVQASATFVEEPRWGGVQIAPAP